MQSWRAPSACALQNHMLEVDARRAPAPGWETIRYMVSVVQYGGRITDEYDKLLMDTLAGKYFQPVRVSCQSCAVPYCGGQLQAVLGLASCKLDQGYNAGLHGYNLVKFED